MAEMSYANRVVVVTGAGRGLGREYALAFAARGAAVVVNDLGTTLVGDGAATSAPADEVVAEIRKAGGRAAANYGSVGTPEGAQGVIATALKEFGQVDTLVNNAGVLNMKPFAEVTLEGLQRHLAVHVLGSFLMCKAVWPHMVARKYGRIVNTISGGIFGLPGLAEYGPAKGGVFAFTRGLALEALEHGIRVNAIAPGLIQTAMGARVPEVSKKRALGSALGRVGEPEEIASVVDFLASDAASFITCTTIEVNGGS